MSTATRQICAKTPVKPSHASTRMFCALAALVAIIALSMHFVGLDKKDVWFDEAVTQQIIAGASDSVFREKIVTRDQLLNTLQLTSENSGLDSTLRIISERFQDQGPIWYFLAKGWAVGFGESLTSLRTFAALFSVIAAPLFYWLVLEFTQSKRAAVIGLVLIAVSPFMMLYSAEARYYTCWVAVLICSGIALLRLCKSPNVKNATLFGVFLAASILTHFATLLMVPGALLFLLSQRLRWNLVLASFVPLLSVPLWFLFIGETGQNLIQDTAAAHLSVPIGTWLAKGQLNLARVFADSGEQMAAFIVWPASSLSIIFIVGSQLLKETTSRQKAFFFLFSLSSPLLFVGLDIMFNGTRAIVLRYQAILIVAIYLAAAFFLDKMLSRSRAMKFAAASILVILVLSGLLSSVRIAHKANPWTKNQYCDLPATIKWLERKNHPLFICGTPQITIAIAQMLPSQTRFLVSDLKEPCVPSDTDGIFVCDPYAPNGAKYFERLKKQFPHIAVKRAPHLN